MGKNEFSISKFSYFKKPRMFNSFSNRFFKSCTAPFAVRWRSMNDMYKIVWEFPCKILMEKGQLTLFLKAITHFGGKFENNFVPLWHDKIYPIKFFTEIFQTCNIFFNYQSKRSAHIISRQWSSVSSGIPQHAGCTQGCDRSVNYWSGDWGVRVR